MRYDIRHEYKRVFFEAPEASVIFEGKMNNIPSLGGFKGALISAPESVLRVYSLKNLQCSTRNSPQFRLLLMKQCALPTVQQ